MKFGLHALVVAMMWILDAICDTARAHMLERADIPGNTSVNAFTDLSRQIQDIASDVHVAAGNPAGKQSGLPSPKISNINFSPSKRDGDADTRKRCYLFMNVVSQLLCQRVFAPFFFTLGYRHREANELFGEFSRLTVVNRTSAFYRVSGAQRRIMLWALQLLTRALFTFVVKFWGHECLSI